MAIQTIPGGLWLPSHCPWNSSAPAFNSIGGLSTANSRVGWVFQVPKTGTLDWFECRQQLNTNTPDNGVRFSFQDLNATGKPDNTEDHYSVVTSGFAAGAWLVPPSYMGTGGPGSGSKRSVTKGDWLACVARFENFVASDSITFDGSSPIGTRIGPNGFLNSYPVTSSDAGTNWNVDSARILIIALKYDDGTYATLDMPSYPFTAFNQRTFGSGSTPDERGLLFQVPFKARLAGIWARVDPDNAFDIVLYDSASSVVISQSGYYTNTYSANGANGFFPFASPPTLTINSNYRIVIKPTTASTLILYDFDVNSSAIRQSLPGGSTWKSTSRTDAGAWTDVDTNLPFMGLVFDGFDDGVGGGGGGEHSAVF